MTLTLDSTDYQSDTSSDSTKECEERTVSLVKWA